MAGPRRKPSLRLAGHDYRDHGAYFVTVTVQAMKCLFGEIVDGDVVLSVPGLMVESWWFDVGRRFPSVTVGTSIVMPNHVHGILWLGITPDSDIRAGGEGDHIGSPVRTSEAAALDFVRVARRGHPAARTDDPVIETPSLSDVVGWFKTMTTNDYIRGVKDHAFPRFDQHLWHRTYYDHIVRNDADLARIETYVLDNPRRWAEDDLNPAR